MNALGLAAAVMAAIALWRTRAKGVLQRRIDDLEKQIRELRRRVNLAEPPIAEPAPPRVESVAAERRPPPPGAEPPPDPEPGEILFAGDITAGNLRLTLGGDPE